MRTCPSRTAVFSDTAPVRWRMLDITASASRSGPEGAPINEDPLCQQDPPISITALLVCAGRLAAGVMGCCWTRRCWEPGTEMGPTRDTRGEDVSGVCDAGGVHDKRMVGKDGLCEQARVVHARSSAWWQETAAVEECKVAR